MTRVFFVVPLVFKRRSVGIRTFPPGHIPPRTFPLPDNSPPFLRGVGHFPLPPCTTITVHCTAGELQTVTSRRRSILHSLGSTKDTSIFGSTGLSVYWNCSLNCMHAAVSVIHSFIHPFNYFTIHIKTKLYSMWNLLEKMSIDCKVRPGTRRLWPGQTVKMTIAEITTTCILKIDIPDWCSVLLLTVYVWILRLWRSACAFLQIILAVGNYVNSSRRGFALGFRLDALTKASASHRLRYHVYFCTNLLSEVK